MIYEITGLIFLTMIGVIGGSAGVLGAVVILHAAGFL